MSPIDSAIPYYPVNDFGPLMKGLVIGGVGIVHVFLAQFAIGGGMLMWYFERLGQRGQQDARTFVDGHFRVLVLVSFVVGALTGVAMWFTTIQVGARTIGLQSGFAGRHVAADLLQRQRAEGRPQPDVQRRCRDHRQ